MSLLLFMSGVGMTDPLRERGAQLVMPCFVVNGYLSLGEIRWSRLVASARVHIERLNERIKRFLWLDSALPVAGHGTCSCKFFVCVFLTRFMGLPTATGM